VLNALWTLKNKRVAVWGLAFKPNTDDIREAPSLRILPELLKRGAKVRAYDPKATENFRRVFLPGEDLTYVEDKYDAVDGAEALLILTEWEEFAKADMKKVRELMELPVVVDGRNVFEPERMKQFGFEYFSIGRG
ncbi:UDP binding domain-containing protein, partial [Hydrogenivirga sp. 128-5-R1-1]|uniref:UDP binding domain-containing protein n=1 Tax=Hydrogenivirga sp. 128-5-R1-1 TaxID=392423 RepID=UPI00015F35DF